MKRAAKIVGSEIVEAWHEAFMRFEASTDDANWMTALRRDAMSHFEALGLPSRRLEEWRYTHLTAFDEPGISAPPPEAIDPGALRRSADRALSEIPLPENGEFRAVFVDGHLVVEASELPPASAGMKFRNFAQIRRLDDDTAVRSLGLGALASDKTDALTALNTAFALDGAVIDIPADSGDSGKLHLLFVSTGIGQLVCPRLLVRVGRNSRARILLDHVSLENGRSIVNAVSEISLDDNAELDWVTLQREREDARHFSNVQIQQGRNSLLKFQTLTLGGGLVRNQIGALLADEGGEANLRGLFMGSGSRHIDNHTLIDHSMPHTTSRQLYKGVLDGQSRGVFRGLIHVRPDAQQTDSQQSNPNLLLSKGARIDTRPQLEIYADDVSCSHGSTVGQLNEDAIFYLRARGLSLDRARALLTRAFVAEICDGLSDPYLREFIGELATAVLADAKADSDGDVA
jgi:Fe-S cluster assembly protein SufD